MDADLEFSLPLPAGSGKAYAERCRELTVNVLGSLLPRERGRWPTTDKIRCQLLVYSVERIDKPLREYVQPTVEMLTSILWPWLANPLILVEQVNGEGIDQRILVRIVRRKLVAASAGEHYEW